MQWLASMIKVEVHAPSRPSTTSQFDGSSCILMGMAYKVFFWNSNMYKFIIPISGISETVAGSIWMGGAMAAL